MNQKIQKTLSNNPTKVICLKVIECFNTFSLFQTLSILKSDPSVCAYAFLRLRIIGTSNSLTKLIYTCQIIDKNSNQATLSEFESIHEYVEFIRQHNLKTIISANELRLFLSKLV